MIKLNGTKVAFGRFPNQELYLEINNVPILPFPQENVVTWVYENNEDFVKLLILSHWLDERNAHKVLKISYMPYSRMDRANGIYVPTLTPAADFVEFLDYEKVIIREPHSEATMDGVPNSERDEWVRDTMHKVMESGGYDSLCFPDAGASVRHNYGDDAPLMCWGAKSRDFASGNIEQYLIKGEIGKRVLIVDDLCSRGGTFVRSAKILREGGALSVGLLVSYLEPNVLTGNVFDYIDNVYAHKDWEGTMDFHPRISYIE